jgi:hypothetical protein
MWRLGGIYEGIKETVSEAQARAIVAGLRQGASIATTAVNYLTPTTLSEAFLATPIGWLVRWASPEYAAQLISDHKKAALKNIADTIPLINKLDGEWFQAAKTGVPASDGTATWTEWRRKAILVANALQAYVEYQSQPLNLVRLAADLVISVVNCATNPGSCMEGPGIPKIPIPWWIWAGAAGGALLGGAYIFNTFAPRRR